MHSLITAVRYAPLSPIALSCIVEPEVVYTLPDFGLIFHRLGEGRAEESKGLSRRREDDDEAPWCPNAPNKVLPSSGLYFGGHERLYVSRAVIYQDGP